ncbi:MAG: bifunctional diguanylate cyclase/phosphodiesterase [Neptuniibacter sp.]
MRSSIAKRYGTTLAITTAVVGCVVLLVNLYFLERYSEESVVAGKQHISRLIETEKIHDAEVMATTLASNLDGPIYHQDFSAIQEILEPLKLEGHITYTYVHDLEGRIIHDGTPEIQTYNQAITSLLPYSLESFSDFTSRQSELRLHVAAPVVVGKTTLAVFRVGLDFEDVKKEVDLLNQQFETEASELRSSILFYTFIAISLLLAITTLLVFLFSRNLFLPIQTLVDRCYQYAEGNKAVQFKLARKDEFGVLGNALQKMKDSVTASQKQIEELAYLDPLTLLPNRRMFNEELETMINWAAAHDHKVALLFIDLDHFKQVNDFAGHDVGDQLLRDVAERLSSLLKEVTQLIDLPIPEKLLLSRLGGDEFVLIVPCFSEPECLSVIARHIEEVLAQAFVIKDERHHISASVGITHYPEKADNITELMKQADIAMYSAKHSGRNRHRFYESDMNSEVLEKIQITSGIRDALDSNDDQLFLTYQPIVSLENSEIIGAEALLRWNHPKKGMIPQDQFIPLIEKSQLLASMTLWVLEQACKDLVTNIYPIDKNFKLSVNISGAVLKNKGLCKKITELLRHHDIPNHCLHIEITETSMMENIDSCYETLSEWKETGVDIWIDDFGTGYSSLGYLHKLPIDGLKIDRSFVSDPSNKHQVIETILALGNSMKLQTISEGIETEEQKKYLQNLGSQYGQGYLFHRPEPLETLVTLLQ